MTFPSPTHMYLHIESQGTFGRVSSLPLRVAAALYRCIFVRRRQVRSHLHRRRDSVPEIRWPSHHRGIRNALQQFVQPRLHVSLEGLESFQRILAVSRRFYLALDNAGFDRYERGDNAIVGLSGVEKLEVVLFEIGLAVIGD